MGRRTLLRCVSQIPAPGETGHPHIDLGSARNGTGGGACAGNEERKELLSPLEPLFARPCCPLRRSRKVYGPHLLSPRPYPRKRLVLSPTMHESLAGPLHKLPR